MHTTTHSSETVGQLVLVDVDLIRQRANPSGPSTSDFGLGRSRFGRCHSSRQVGPLGAEHVRNGVQHVDGSDEVPVDVERTAGGRTLLDGEIRLVRGSSS